MSETKATHSPGRWTIMQMPHGPWLVHNAEGSIAGTAHKGFGPNDLAIEAANARLIAAAPELLEACKVLVHYSEVSCKIGRGNGGMMYGIEKTRAAIAKATGEEGEERK